MEAHQSREDVFWDLEHKHGIKLSRLEEQEVAILHAIRPLVLMKLIRSFFSDPNGMATKASGEHRQGFLEAVKMATEHTLQEIAESMRPSSPGDDDVAMEEDIEVQRWLTQPALSSTVPAEANDRQRRGLPSANLKRELQEDDEPPSSPTPKRHCPDQSSQGLFPAHLSDSPTTTASSANSESCMIKLFKEDSATGTPTTPRTTDSSDPFASPVSGPTEVKAAKPVKSAPDTEPKGKSSGPVNCLPTHERTEKVFASKIPNAPGIQWEVHRIAWEAHKDSGRTTYEGPELAGVPKVSAGCWKPHAELYDYLCKITRSSKTLVERQVITELDLEYAAGAMRSDRAWDPNIVTQPGDPFKDFPLGWYGGKVIFRVAIRAGKDRKAFEFAPLAPTIAPSTTLRRRFGSHRFIEMKIDNFKTYKTEDLENLRKVINEPFDYLGHVWRAYDVEDEVIYFVRLNERTANSCSPTARRDRTTSADILLWPDPPELDDYRSFVEYFGATGENRHVSTQKFSARWKLTRSATQPIVRFDAFNIRRGPDRDGIEDIIADGADDPSEAKYCMTDGAGYVSGAVLQMVQQKCNLPAVPTTVQARIGHSIKGTLWACSPFESCRLPLTAADDFCSSLDPNWKSDDPTSYAIVLKSQCKLRQPADAVIDGSHCVFNLVTIGRASYPARSNFQVIDLLAHGGVSKEAFAKALRAYLQEMFADLMSIQKFATETDENYIRRLYQVMQRGVVQGRIRREKGAASRSIMGRRDDDEEEDLEADVDYAYEGYGAELASPAGISDAIAKDPNSGQPKSLPETVLALLAAGFTPFTSWLVAEKLRCIVSTAVENAARKLHFAFPGSASAMIIPDPLGILEEDEIFFGFTTPRTDPFTGLQVTCVEGPVCLVRHPALLPTDVQVAKAVNVPELHKWKDVIVFPIKGFRSLASKLAGGDYDGDRVVVIWTPEVVEHFKTAPPDGMDPPQCVLDSFIKSPQRLGDLMDSISSLEAPDWDLAMVDRFTASLTASRQFGQYSLYHVLCCYIYGPQHPTSIRMAHTVCLLLDAGKSGLRLKEEVERADRKEFNRPMPSFHTWMKTKRLDDNNFGWDQHYRARDLPERPKSLGSHVLDHLKKVAEDCHFRFKKRLDDLTEKTTSALELRLPVEVVGVKKPIKDKRRRPKDCPITKFWAGLVERAQSEPLELEDVMMIVDHVDNMRELWHSCRSVPTSPSKSRSPAKQGSRAKIASDLASASTKAPTNVAAVAAKFRHDLDTTKMSCRTLRHDQDLLDLLKAAAAFDRFPRERFPGDMAFEALCEIKARSSIEKPALIVQPINAALSLDKRMVELAAVFLKAEADEKRLSDLVAST